MPSRTANCVHRVFEDQVGLNPDKTAVMHLGESLSYKQLNSRANYLAQHLLTLGVSPDDVIAIAIPRSIEMVVSMLAILKCGAAYLPVDLSAPLSNNLACFDAASVKIVVSGIDTEEYSSNRHVNISTDETYLFNSELHDFKSVEGGADSPAYVMFTSGSTGMPKGVVVPHRAINRLVRNSNYIQIDTSDNILQFAPPSFDASTFEFWGALLNGARLVLYSGSALDPNMLKNDIEDNRITVLWLTAALFHLVAENYVEIFSPLKILLAGGDVLNVKHVNKVLDAVPGIKVINGYGPTENTTFTCCHVMDQNNKPTDEVLIGKPITGTDINILDESLEDVEKGSAGELFASGSGVALGYLNGGANNEAFFHNEAIAPGLIYRTGDLVKENKYGELSFIGRKDDQVKLRGYRVSLGEIKQLIVQHEQVADALVMKRDSNSGDQLLIAYIKIKEGTEPCVQDIKENLLMALPKYMIPDKFVVDTKLPINSNGKLDRRSIKETIEA